MKRFLMMAASILIAVILPFAAVGLFVFSLVGLYLLNPVLGNLVYAALAVSAFAFFVFVVSRSLFDLFSTIANKADSKTEVSDDENR